MNSEKYYHEEYNISNYNFLNNEWQNNPSQSNIMMNYIQPDNLEYLFNSRYSDFEQYQVLQQSDSANNSYIQNNDYPNNEIIMSDAQNKWNDQEADFQSSEKQQIQENIEEQDYIQQYQGKQRSQLNMQKQYSNRSHSASSECSGRDNSSSSQEKSSSNSSNKSYSVEDSSESISISRKKNYARNEESSSSEQARSAKNKQSQHKNVVKNIGLGFKNYLIDSKSPLNSKIQEILKESRITHFEFRQWINTSVKLDQKKEIYKALNIKQDDSQKIQSYKRILFTLFSIFFEEQYASSYLWKNNNIQNKDIHISFIKHFIQSSRDTDYLLKKWK